MMHVAFSIKPKILLKAENCMEFFLESLLGKSNQIKEIFLIRTIQPTKENQMEQKFLAKKFFQNLAIPSEVVLFSKKKAVVLTSGEPKFLVQWKVPKNFLFPWQPLGTVDPLCCYASL